MRAVIVLALLGSSTAWAFDRAHLPIADAELPKPFPLVPRGELNDREVKRDVGPYSLEVGKETMVLSGRDKKGSEWKVTLGAPRLEGKIFTADLDQDGQQDVVLAVPTGGNGMAPSWILTVVRMDADGRPIPWSINGYFEVAQEGIAELVDLDGDGRAELLHMGYDDGYWYTSLYQAAPRWWSRSSGKVGRFQFPMWTRFTDKPNRKAGPVDKTHRPWEVDFSTRLSTTGNGLHGMRVAKLEIGDLKLSTDPQLTFEDKATCRFSAWNMTAFVVVDWPTGREAVSLSASEEFVKVLREAKARQWEGEYAGQRVRAACTPELLWFKAPERRPVEK